MNSVFTLTPTNNLKLQKYKEKAMKELNEFFELNWVEQTPKVFIVNDRNTINLLWEKEMSDSVVGWMWAEKAIFILNPDNISKESRYEADTYHVYKLIKHELCHAYFTLIFGTSNFRWINEGVSIYTAEQLDRWPMPKIFLGFLDNNDIEIMKEAGSAVKLIVDNHGKDKLFKFLEGQKGIQTKSELESLFTNIFGASLDYSYFNSLR